MNWTDFDLDMPSGITILQGENNIIPLKAWVAMIDLNKWLSESYKVSALEINKQDNEENNIE